MTYLICQALLLMHNETNVKIYQGDYQVLPPMEGIVESNLSK
jgi:hypothetical protein